MKLRSPATFAIRSARAGDASLMEEVRQAVRSVNASVPIGQERTMQSLYAGSLAGTSFTLVLLAIAGAMALALGIIGIYGVIAYVTAIMVLSLGDGGYLVGWGTREGYAKLTMRAELAEGGDSADPDAWHTRIVERPGASAK